MAYDLSTASLATSLYVGATFTPYAISFNSSGYILYITGTNNIAYQYNLSTAYDLTTAVYYGELYDFSPDDNIVRGIYFKPDDTIMYVTGQGRGFILAYNLS